MEVGKNEMQKAFFTVKLTTNKGPNGNIFMDCYIVKKDNPNKHLDNQPSKEDVRFINPDNLTKDFVGNICVEKGSPTVINGIQLPICSGIQGQNIGDQKNLTVKVKNRKDLDDSTDKDLTMSYDSPLKCNPKPNRKPVDSQNTESENSTLSRCLPSKTKPQSNKKKTKKPKQSIDADSKEKTSSSKMQNSKKLSLSKDSSKESSDKVSRNSIKNNSISNRKKSGKASSMGKHSLNSQPRSFSSSNPFLHPASYPSPYPNYYIPHQIPYPNALPPNLSSCKTNLLNRQSPFTNQFFQYSHPASLNRSTPNLWRSNTNQKCNKCKKYPNRTGASKCSECSKNIGLRTRF